MGGIIDSVTSGFGLLGDENAVLNHTQVTAPTNNYQATAPVNAYQARGATNLSTADYANAIRAAQSQAAGGGGPATGTIARQNALSDSLSQAAAGNGPSPAQAQLQQTTQQNINSAAGQAASARGVNAALAARMAVNTAGGANQQAAGQAATLRAQEQIAARDQLAQNLASTAGTQLNQQSTGVSALGTAGQLQNVQNAGQIQNALGTQQINADVAARNQQADLAAQQLNQATAGQNANLDLQAQQLRAGIGAQNAQTNANIQGGMMQSIGSVMSMFARGGTVPPPVHLFGGGGLGGMMGGGGEGGGMMGGGGGGSGPSVWKIVGKGLQGQGKGLSMPTTGAYELFVKLPFGDPAKLPNPYTTKQGGEPGKGDGGGSSDSLGDPNAGTANALGDMGDWSQGSPQGAGDFDVGGAEMVAAHGGQVDFRGGGDVPGAAKVAGDSQRNDTVPAMLSPGEIVIPRTVAQAPDAAEQAAAFVRAIKAQKEPEGRGGGYGRVLAARRRAA